MLKNLVELEGNNYRGHCGESGLDSESFESLFVCLRASGLNSSDVQAVILSDDNDFCRLKLLAESISLQDRLTERQQY